MQLEFQWREPAALQRELVKRTGEPIDLTLTDNSSSIMTFRSASKGKPARLRIHHMFLGAEPDVLEALAVWLTRRRTPKSAAALDGFIKRNEHLIARAKKRNVPVSTAGRLHDLQLHYDELNVEHFENSVSAPITWGRMPTTRRRRSIRFGSFTPEDNLIRVHPLLDQDFVPAYFVRYIVFHEMLHAYLGIETLPNGRRRIHSPEFKRREKAYPDYNRSVAWHDDPKNMRRILRQPRKVA